MIELPSVFRISNILHSYVLVFKNGRRTCNMKWSWNFLQVEMGLHCIVPSNFYFKVFAEAIKCTSASIFQNFYWNVRLNNVIAHVCSITAPN